MRHRFEPKPIWKVWYGISYYDCNWDEIKALAENGLDAFAVTGRVYAFTRMWTELERGRGVELPCSDLPIAFTIEAYHVSDEEETKKTDRCLCAGHTPGCRACTPGRPGSEDGTSGVDNVHDAPVGRQDANPPSREDHNPSGRSSLAGADRHADRDNYGEDCELVPNYVLARPKFGDSRETDCMGPRLAAEQKKAPNH